MNQLTVLSALCWAVWWFGYGDEIKSVESVALIFAGFAFNSLLFLHLWFKFIILPTKKKYNPK